MTARSHGTTCERGSGGAGQATSALTATPASRAKMTGILSVPFPASICSYFFAGTTTRCGRVCQEEATASSGLRDLQSFKQTSQLCDWWMCHTFGTYKCRPASLCHNECSSSQTTKCCSNRQHQQLGDGSRSSVSRWSRNVTVGGSLKIKSA